MTTQEILNWSDKHKKLKGEGVRVVHVQQLIKQILAEQEFKQQMEYDLKYGDGSGN